MSQLFLKFIGPFFVLVVVSLSIELSQTKWLFMYEGNAVREGQAWRIFSAHFSHISWLHFIQNMGALFGLLCVFPVLNKSKVLFSVVAISGFSISMNYYLYYPPETTYVGLSGVLHALAAFGAITMLSERPALNSAFLILLASKLLVEQMFVLNESLATEAHVLGTVIGFWCGACVYVKRAARVSIVELGRRLTKVVIFQCSKFKPSSMND